MTAALDNDSKVPWTVESLREEIAQRRRERSEAGCTWRGHRVRTDQSTRSALVELILRCQLNVPFAKSGFDWKFPDGFQRLSPADLIDLFKVVSGHVQYCFDMECILLEALNHGDPLDEVAALMEDLTW